MYRKDKTRHLYTGKKETDAYLQEGQKQIIAFRKYRNRQNLQESLQTTIKYMNMLNIHLSYDVASGSEITPCNKNCKPLVVYRFTGNVMTSITTTIL